MKTNIHFWSYLAQQWRTEAGLGGSNPPPQIPKALHRAKLNPIVKTVKHCWI